MRGIRAIAAASVAVRISFGIGSLSKKSLEIRSVPDTQGTVSVRIIESLTPEKLLTAFVLRHSPTTFGWGLGT
jgi:hypothetical protein